MLISNKIAESLKWEHMDILEWNIKIIDNYKGLFLFSRIIKSIEDANKRFLDLYQKLEKNIYNLAIKKELIDDNSDNYNPSLFLDLLEKNKVFNIETLNKIKEIIDFKNMVTYKELKPSLEDFIEVINSLETIFAILINLL